MILEFVKQFSFELPWSWFPDFIGCLGAMVVLTAYALLQAGKLRSEGILYSFLNLVAALLILISLIYSWNLAAAVMEIAWLMISAFGMVKGFFKHPNYQQPVKSW